MSRIAPLFALVVAAGLIFGYIAPTWTGGIESAKAAIASENQALAAADAYTAKEDELAKEKQAISDSDLSRLAVLLPDSVNNVQLILDLNALAARSGLTLSGVNVENPTDTGSDQSPVGSINLTVSAAGSYASFRAFLDGVEKSERLLDVTNLSITGSDTGVYSYTFTLRLYWLR